MGESKRKICLNVERRFLFIKIHYFLIYGGTFIIEPYFFAYGQQLGLTYDSVYLIYTVLHFTFIFSKPIVGAISDRYQLMKSIIMVLVTTSAMLWWLILLIPPIVRDTDSKMIPMKCDEKTLRIVPSINYSSSCFTSLLNSGSTCNFRVEQCNDILGKNTEYCAKTCKETAFEEHTPQSDSLNEIANYSFIRLTINNSLPCYCVGTMIHLVSCNHSSDACFSETQAGNVNIDEVMKRWSFAALIIASGTAIANALSLTDAACCKLLEEKTELYGKQRLWGTVSVVLCTLLSSYLLDRFSEKPHTMNCITGLCIMSILFFFDLLVIFHLDMRYIYVPEVFKKVGHIFTSIKNVLFAIGTFLIGGLTGVLLYYRFLYLTDLWASSLLLVLTEIIARTVGEIPCFSISGKLIGKCGYFYCLISAFAAFTLRYSLYCFLNSPWYIMPIEIIYASAYGIFYATMVSFAHEKAPSGMEATVLGVFGGLYDGLGISIGATLCKFGISNLGSGATFLVAAIISGAAVFVFYFIKLMLKPSYARTARQHNRW